MSVSYWRVAIALGIVAFGSLALGQDRSEAEQIGNQQGATTSGAESQSKASDEVGESGPSWENFLAFAGDQEAPDNAQDCDDACQRDNDDLEAQRSMAGAA